MLSEDQKKIDTILTFKKRSERVYQIIPSFEELQERYEDYTDLVDDIQDVWDTNIDNLAKICRALVNQNLDSSMIDKIYQEHLNAEKQFYSISATMLLEDSKDLLEEYASKEVLQKLHIFDKELRILDATDYSDSIKVSEDYLNLINKLDDLRAEISAGITTRWKFVKSKVFWIFIGSLIAALLVGIKDVLTKLMWGV